MLNKDSTDSVYIFENAKKFKLNEPDMYFYAAQAQNQTFESKVMIITDVVK